MAPLGGLRTTVAKKNGPPFPPAQCWECETGEATTHAPFNLGQGGRGIQPGGRGKKGGRGAILFVHGCMVLAKSIWKS